MLSFSSLLVILLGLFSSTNALTTPMELRDLFNPAMTSPTANTVWKVGNKYNVTWLASFMSLENYDSQLHNTGARITLQVSSTTPLGRSNLSEDARLLEHASLLPRWPMGST
jgi:hypothetical protein